jgi:hypothetical protein
MDPSFQVGSSNSKMENARLFFFFKGMKTKKSCHKQDPFQNINPNITLEIKSFHQNTLNALAILKLTN